jgi:hypothetical protein
VTDRPAEPTQDDGRQLRGRPGPDDVNQVDDDSTGAPAVSGLGANRRVLGSVAPWALCALITIGGYQLLLAPGRSYFNLVFVLVLLGLLAGTSLIRPSLGALTLVALGVLLAWPLPVEWLRSTWPSGAYKQDLSWIGGMTVLVVGLVTAIWQRPPSRRPDGTSVVASRLVNWIALLCTVGGPIIGLVAFVAFARGDIYMRPAVLGLAVGLFGLILFSGYSAFHVLLGRPERAVILAVVYPALLLILVSAAPHWVVPRSPVPEAIVESRLPDGRLLMASRASPAGPPAYALDGRPDTAWNAGTYAPAWIEIDLGKPRTVTEIRLLVEQSPDGETIHQAIGISSTGSEFPLAEFRGFTRAGEWLTQSVTPPLVGIQSVRITTWASPSWVAWREIELILDQP